MNDQEDENGGGDAEVFNEPPGGRAGFIALVGAPNAGKSTLLNAVLGIKISITAPRPQTTRNRILGIHNVDETQLIFVDTPGIHRPRGLMHQRMVERARESVGDADIACWIIDVGRGLRQRDIEEIVALAPQPTVVVLNKVDTIDKRSLLPMLAKLSEVAPAVECVPVSALKHNGVDELIRVLARMVPEGPWLYPEDALTDQTDRFFVAELVREQLFRRLREEMPYRLAVVTEGFEEKQGRVWIQCLIYTDTDSSKKIIIGKAGEAIKAVGIAARKGCELHLQCPVDLRLEVKVRKSWQQDRQFLSELGI